MPMSTSIMMLAINNVSMIRCLIIVTYVRVFTETYVKTSHISSYFRVDGMENAVAYYNNIG